MDLEQKFVIASISRKDIGADFNRVGKELGVVFNDSSHLDDDTCKRVAKFYPIDDSPGADHYYDAEIISIMVEKGLITQEQNDKWWNPKGL